jgi:DNA-binding NarL/FixJ family response regulator
MSRSTKHYRIVLADDDEDDRSFFRDAVNQLPTPSVLHIFTDGQKLLNYLFEEEELPDIIFLDLHMPKKDGIECIREIRKQARFNEVPIVMFTLAGQAPYTKDPKQPLANKYIEKTGSFNTLVQTLNGLLSEEGYQALLSQPRDQAI